MKKAWGTALGALLVLAAAGCATGGGMTDEDHILAAFADWKTAVETKNMAVAEARYSENYKDDNASSKAGAIEWMNDAIAQGYLDGAAIGTDAARLTIDGAAATYGPLDFKAETVSFTLDMRFAKEDTGWLITRVDAY